MKDYKKHVTKGKVTLKDSDPIVITDFDGLDICKVEIRDFSNKDLEQFSNAQLIAEAFNVLNETGSTPRELMEHKKTLTEVVNIALSICNKRVMPTEQDLEILKIDLMRVISKTKQ